MPLQTPDDWRRVIANYWGLCSQVDTYVGEMLATLDECGLAENTIVVFTSDHGDMMGSHRLIAKGFMFEEAVRVPLMIRLPGHTAGRRVLEIQWRWGSDPSGPQAACPDGSGSRACPLLSEP